MNRKAQLNLGMILSVFIGVLVGAVLMTSVASFVGTATGTGHQNDTLDGTSTTAPASGAVIDLPGQELLSTAIVVNATSGAAVPATNYTIDEGLSATTGLKTIRYTTTTNGNFASEAVNISYTFGPDGYIDNSGGRAIASLIVLFMALGIAVVALIPSIRTKLMDIGR